MAGSYKHAVTEKGKLRNNKSFATMIENIGDAYEMAEEMYGMIWWLAMGNRNAVEEARQSYKEGISEHSPGVQKDRDYTDPA